jgi:hypothetical protein
LLVYAGKQIHLLSTKPSTTFLESFPMVNATDGSPETLLSEVTDGAFPVDLAGIAVPDSVEAMAALEKLLDEGLASARSQGFEKVWFSFPLAVPGQGQTLFAPVGKALRARLSANKVVRVMPASAGGWLVRL